jgi:DNA-3-methyladenine glycosylase II
MYITPPEIFSFKESLYFLKRSPHELLHFTDDNSVEKFIRVKNKNVIFSIREAGKKLRVDFLNGKFSSEIETAVSGYIHHWFDLETDLVSFYKTVKKDALLKSITRKYHGYRIISIPDLFESLSWAIIGQQINLSFAYQLKKRFVESFGSRLQFNGRTYFLFPEPQKVTGLDRTDLLPLQFSRQKADYIIGIAKEISTGNLSQEKLATLSFSEAHAELIRYKGIGNWTANYALMKTFHHPSAFPLEDAGLHQALRNQLKLEVKPTKAEVEKLFKKYKGWEAYATLYFWRTLGEPD